MKLLQILLNPKYRIYYILILILIAAYIILRIFIFESDPVLRFLSSLGNSYLLLAEMFANQLLYWTGSGVTVENHKVIMKSVALDGFIPMLYFKKWLILFLTMIWITRTTRVNRALISILLLVVHFLVVSIYITVGAHISGVSNFNYALLSIPLTIGLLTMVTIVFFWYRKHRDLIFPKLSGLNLNAKLFQNDFHVFAVVCLYIIIVYFVFEIFDFNIWIDFLFTASQKILGLVGYEANIDFNGGFYLIGENGSIFMLKSCLGFHTMLLFAIIVYLTGNSSNRIRWTYIISGFVFLNFVNILRFVFLFIHIQKNGDYMLAMEVHDMYNYIIYAIVFILWVIWFEKFANYRRK